MTRTFSALVVAIVFAQQAAVSSLGTTSSDAVRPAPAAPAQAAATVGFHRVTADSAAVAPAPAEPRLGAGRNVALMVVGAAALIIGLVVGGDAGTIVAVSGAVIGLFGLYRFVQ